MVATYMLEVVKPRCVSFVYGSDAKLHYKSVNFIAALLKDHTSVF